MMIKETKVVGGNAVVDDGDADQGEQSGRNRPVSTFSTTCGDRKGYVLASACCVVQRVSIASRVSSSPKIANGRCRLSTQFALTSHAELTWLLHPSTFLYCSSSFTLAG